MPVSGTAVVPSDQCVGLNRPAGDPQEGAREVCGSRQLAVQTPPRRRLSRLPGTEAQSKLPFPQKRAHCEMSHPALCPRSSVFPPRQGPPLLVGGCEHLQDRWPLGFGLRCPLCLLFSHGHVCSFLPVLTRDPCLWFHGCRVHGLSLCEEALIFH